MKKFVINIIVLLISVSLSISLYFFFTLGGTSDFYYLRVSSPRQKSMVLGSSRAAQGIQPSYFNKSTVGFDKPMYNFSFTIDDSRYGEVYLKAIKHKLDSSTHNGFFILEVNPLMISCHHSNISDDPKLFAENKMLLNTVSSFTSNPNFEYIFKFIASPYSRLSIYTLVDKINLNDDGWLEISVSMNSKSIKERTKLKVDYYKNIIPLNRNSPTRLLYLKKTIAFLQNYGKVILVRLPICEDIYQLEQNLMPGFDTKMDSLSSEFGVPYLNLISNFDKYETTDGNHLDKKTGKKIADTIIFSIKNSFEYQ